jgi:hypothetical protein
MMLESAGVHHDNLGSILAGDRGQSAFCITSSRGNVVGDTRGCAEVSIKMSVLLCLLVENIFMLVDLFVFGSVRRSSRLFASIILVSSCSCIDSSPSVHRIRNILIDTGLRTRRNIHLNNEANTFEIVPNGSVLCVSLRELHQSASISKANRFVACLYAMGLAQYLDMCAEL